MATMSTLPRIVSNFTSPKLISSGAQTAVLFFRVFQQQLASRVRTLSLIDPRAVSRDCFESVQKWRGARVGSGGVGRGKCGSNEPAVVFLWVGCRCAHASALSPPQSPRAEPQLPGACAWPWLGPLWHSFNLRSGAGTSERISHGFGFRRP